MMARYLPPLTFRRISVGTVILIITMTVVSGGIAGAQEDLEVDVEAPNEATVGEDVTVSATISIPDLMGDLESDMTVTLMVDGEEVDSETVTVSDGSETEVSFTTSFDSSGEHTVSIEASVELGTTSLSGSSSTKIQVNEPQDPTATQPPADDDPNPLTEATGASFAVPESLEDEVNQYREQANVDSNLEAFVLANQDNLYLVFTEQTPTKGKATVRGATLSQDFSAQGLTFGAIVAEQVSFETEGTQLSLSEVANNPDDHRLELIRLTATYRRVASLTDPDQGNDFTAAVTSGVLVESSASASSMFNQLGQTARGLNHNLNASAVDSTLDISSQPHLFTFMFETLFWTDRATTVDGILLDPESAAYEFVSTVDESNAIHTGQGSPLLYVVNEQFSPTEIENVRSVKQQADELDGTVISVEARVLGQTISSQETVEHNTPCGEDQTQIKEACVNIPQDVLLHSGIAWNEIPASKEDVLFIVGASSRHQDTPAEGLRGRYRIIGEVVSTSRVDESLPEGSILLIYDMERVGDINYDEVGEEARQLIENQSKLLRNQIQSQIRSQGAAETSTETSTEAGGQASTEETGTTQSTQGATTDTQMQNQEAAIETTDQPETDGDDGLADNIPGSPGFTPLITLIGLLVFVSWRVVRDRL